MIKSDLEEVESIHIQLFPLRYSKSVFQNFLESDFLSLVLVGIKDDKTKIIGVSTSHR